MRQNLLPTSVDFPGVGGAHGHRVKASLGGLHVWLDGRHQQRADVFTLEYHHIDEAATQLYLSI